MKSIVCFGDSNTWGADPVGKSRHGTDTRWPRVMARELGEQYEVIEEGLSGRTTVWEDPIEEYKCGKSQLVPIIKSHQPFDLLIIMLGTNDLKHRFSLTPSDIAKGAGRLVQMARQTDAGIGGAPPEVLLVCPPPVVKLSSNFEQMFQGAYEKSRGLKAAFSAVAAELSCHFLDAGEVIESSPADGIHFDAENQRKLGRAMAAKVREIAPV